MSRGGRRLRWPAPLLLGTLLACLAFGALGPATAGAAAPRLTVRAAALYAPATGQFLYADHADDELAVASTTKLMTALITLESVGNLNSVFTQNNYYPAAVDSQIGLVPCELMTVRDLVIALMLPSAEDAAEDRAYNIGHGSVARFVAMMNVRARQLGLTHTHYSTPSGLDTVGNHSTAADLDRLAAYDLQHSAFFARIVDLPAAILRSGNHVRDVLNRNTLVGQFPWIDGVKTGHTAGAGYVLVASAHRGGLRLVSSVLGTTSEASRDANTLRLLDWGYQNFRLRTLLRAGEPLARPGVVDQSGLHPELIAARGLQRVVGWADRLAVRVQAPRRLTGPLRRHAPIGTAIVLDDGRAVASVPLLLDRAVPEAPTLTGVGKFLVVLSIILVAGGGGAIALNARQRRRMRESERGLEAA